MVTKLEVYRLVSSQIDEREPDFVNCTVCDLTSDEMTHNALISRKSLTLPWPFGNNRNALLTTYTEDNRETSIHVKKKKTQGSTRGIHPQRTKNKSIYNFEPERQN